MQNCEKILRKTNFSDKIFILFAVYTRPKALEVRENLMERLNKGGK